MVTRSIRSAIISHHLAETGLKNSDDISKSLKPYRIGRDNADLEKLITAIESTMNPFSSDCDGNLHCLTTGLSVSHDVKADLLNFLTKGQEWHNEFRDACFTDP